MRLRKRHAWGAVLIVVFVLPVLQPGGIALVERPAGAVVNWFAQVPGLNPKLLGGPPPPVEPDASRRTALDRQILVLWEHVHVLRDRLRQAGELGQVLGDEGLDRLPPTVRCRVLRSRDPVSFRRSLLLDRGAAHGLRVGHPVIVGGVYLGRVEVVYAHVAVVQLVTDPQARAEVLVRTSKGKGLRGYARRRGQKDGDDMMAVEFVRRRGEVGEIHPGAPVFTASFHPDVPDHLLIGRIDEVSDPDMDAMPTLTMRPAFDLDGTYEVLVLLTDPTPAPRFVPPGDGPDGTPPERDGAGPARDGGAPAQNAGRPAGRAGNPRPPLSRTEPRRGE